MTGHRLLALFLLLLPAVQAGEVQVKTVDDVLRLSVDGKAICDYQMAPGEVPRGSPKPTGTGRTCIRFSPRVDAW